MDAVTPSEGWGVLHLFYLDRPGAGRRRARCRQAGARRRSRPWSVTGTRPSSRPRSGTRPISGSWRWAPIWPGSRRSRPSWPAAPLRLESSFVSLTETSEYTSTEEQERERLSSHTEGLDDEAIEARLEAWRTRMAKYREDKLHPRLPLKKLICFYPMAKRRKNNANWYQLSFEERRTAHGRPRPGRHVLRRPGAAADHELLRLRRLGVGRDPPGRRSGGPQGDPLRDALRRGLRRVLRLRPVHRGAPGRTGRGLRRAGLA